MNDKERRKKRLLRLPAVENWVRNNKRRLDETVFALRNFDLNPPRLILSPVRALCSDVALARVEPDEIDGRIEAIKHPSARASARELVPAFREYLRRFPIEGLNAFETFRVTYPIGPNPLGGTLAIPVAPTFVGLRRDSLVPVFLIPWASLEFDDFQKVLMSSIIKDALLSHQDFIESDAEILSFPRLEHESERYEASWAVRSYATMDRDDLNRQFVTYGRAFRHVIDELDASQEIEG
jgi:hypothetical protein